MYYLIFKTRIWDHYYLQFIGKFDYRDILLEKSYTDHWLFRKLK